MKNLKCVSLAFIALTQMSLISAMSETQWEKENRIMSETQKEKISRISNLIKENILSETFLLPELSDIILGYFDVQTFLEIQAIETRKLMVAIKDNDLKKAEEAIINGADVNFRDNVGNTPLALAADKSGRDSLEIAKLLIIGGANVNLPNGFETTALMKAAKNGNFELVEILLNSGADPEMTNAYGKKAYQLTDNQEIHNLLSREFQESQKDLFKLAEQRAFQRRQEEIKRFYQEELKRKKEQKRQEELKRQEEERLAAQRIQEAQDRARALAEAEFAAESAAAEEAWHQAGFKEGSEDWYEEAPAESEGNWDEFESQD